MSSGSVLKYKMIYMREGDLKFKDPMVVAVEEDEGLIYVDEVGRRLLE